MAKRSSSPSDQAQQRKGYRRRKAKAQAKTQALQDAEARRLEGLPVTKPMPPAWTSARGRIGSASVPTKRPTSANSRRTPTACTRCWLICTSIRSRRSPWNRRASTGSRCTNCSSHGFEVLLVDPSYTKQVRGRPKTDRRDCQWIYRLHSVGLLAAAFRPDEKTCQLRAYLRQRANLIRYAAQHIQHMEKALEQMNLKLTEIISDITGSTGRQIIQAILRGVRDPHKLAKFRHQKCHASEAEIAQALTGSYRDEHLFACGRRTRPGSSTRNSVDQVDVQIAAATGPDETGSGLAALETPAALRRSQAERPAFRRAHRVVLRGRHRPDGDRRDRADDGPDHHQRNRPGGIEVRHGEALLQLAGAVPADQEVGRPCAVEPNASRGQSSGRGLPDGREQFAWQQRGLGAFLRHKKAQLGAPKAITATAHKLARLVYLALKHGMTYVRQTQEEYQSQDARATTEVAPEESETTRSDRARNRAVRGARSPRDGQPLNQQSCRATTTPAEANPSKPAKEGKETSSSSADVSRGSMQPSTSLSRGSSSGLACSGDVP